MFVNLMIYTTTLHAAAAVTIHCVIKIKMFKIYCKFLAFFFLPFWTCANILDKWLRPPFVTIAPKCQQTLIRRWEFFCFIPKHHIIDCIYLCDCHRKFFAYIAFEINAKKCIVEFTEFSLEAPLVLVEFFLHSFCCCKRYLKTELKRLWCRAFN